MLGEDGVYALCREENTGIRGRFVVRRRCLTIQLAPGRPHFQKVDNTDMAQYI